MEIAMVKDNEDVSMILFMELTIKISIDYFVII